MALDNGYALPTRTLPTSADVTHETPTLDISRHSSCHGSSSPLTNSSPPPSPPGGASYRSRLQGDRDGGYIEKRSSIDSRRFTSDLDNSLIQQIHTLRLELESKNVAVDSLEERLQKSTNENKQMSEDLSVQATEARSLRKQMQLLESGTLAALGDIAKERDAAIGTMTDTRKRLELSNKKIRSQEEEAEKALAIREKEQEDWVDEKRNLERKVHVLENRLKTMVTELVATDTTAQNLAGIGFDSDDTSREALAKADAFSARSSNRPDSRMSTRSSGEYHDPRDPNIRAPSRLIALHEIVEPNLSSLSLADELEGEDEDEDSEQEEEKDDRLHTPTFPEALPEENEHRAIRYSEDQKARKMMGLASEPLESTCDKETSGQRTMGNIMDPINHTLENRMLQYTDTATQFSTPPSPTLPSQRCDSAMTHNVEQTNDITDRKRQSVEILPLSSEQAPSPTSNASKPAELVSSSCQTDETTFTTPAIIEPESVSSAGMTDSSTQTTEEQSSLQSIAARGLALSSMSVPVITIEPPASRPPSSHASVVLPPRTRNAGSQAAIEQPRDLRSISIQTDDIRIDGRPARPFPRVGSSHTSGPSSSKQTERWEQTGVPPAPRIPRRILRPPVLQNDPPPASPPISSIRDAYPGNNDNGPLDNRQQSGPRRPIRRDSIFAGFSDDDDEIADIVGDDFSDDGAVTDPPVRKTLSKVKDSWKLVPQSQSSIPNRRDIVSDTEAQVQAGSSATLTMNRPKQNRRTSENLPTKGTAPPPLKLNSSREPDIRRTALVSSGSTTHTQRQRSPSAPSSSGLVPVPPPFPVPTRSSSRKIPISASDGAGSPTPRSTSFFTSRRSRQQGRPPVKRKILRKTQSAAAVTLPPQPNRPPPPPPPLPPLPPLPPPPMELPSNPPSTPRSEPQSRNQFILPYPDELASRKQSTEPSISKSHLSEAVIEPSSQQTSVVDAIAQTMVGEWMWKYVRKRTSFGITETPQAEFENGKSETGSTGGARHKRWVWLAPYERAVIWSGKQPTSGPALLGKGGRKLAIQSVLDVKDDAPLPKGASNEPVFNRSILILTPTRALKFTATSKERHYIWLTALSFLSASGQGVADLETPSPDEQPPQIPRPPSREPVIGIRRKPIRDSIRISKAKSRPSIGPHSLSSPPSDIGFNNSAAPALEDIAPDSEEAAEPPQIPRVAAHSRKRSSTGPRPAPLSAFHNYPSQPTATSSMDPHGPTARDKYEKFSIPSRSGSGPATAQSTMTEASIVPNNFFDAVGTVRMEAFVENEENHGGEKKRLKESKSYRSKQGKKKNMMSYWGVSEGGDARQKAEDPFKGF